MDADRARAALAEGLHQWPAGRASYYRFSALLSMANALGRAGSAFDAWHDTSSLSWPSKRQ